MSTHSSKTNMSIPVNKRCTIPKDFPIRELYHNQPTNRNDINPLVNYQKTNCFENLVDYKETIAKMRKYHKKNLTDKSFSQRVGNVHRMLKIIENLQRDPTQKSDKISDKEWNDLIEAINLQPDEIVLLCKHFNDYTNLL